MAKEKKEKMEKTKEKKVKKVKPQAKKVKKDKKKKEKKPSYLKEVRQEMKKVTFPSAKEVFKYTVATILIVAFLVVFFLGLSALLSWVKGGF